MRRHLIWISGGGGGNYRILNTNGGSPRGATERGWGAYISPTRPGAAEFWRGPPNFHNISGAGAPIPQHPIGQWGYGTTEEKRQTTGPHGTLRNAAGAKIRPPRPGIHHILAGAPNFPPIFFASRAPFPTPNWERGAKIPNAKRRTAELHGSPKFRHAAQGSTVCWRARPIFPNIFAPETPFPKTQLGMCGIRNCRRQKTPRGAMGRYRG